MSNQLIKYADRLCSDIVRVEAGYQCVKCMSTNRVGPHHYFTRVIKNTRWDIENLTALCFRCHIRWAQVYTEDFRDFFIQRIGQAAFHKLKIRAAVRNPKIDLKLMVLALQHRLDSSSNKRLG